MRRGREGSVGTVVAVVPECVAPGLSGCQHPRLVVNVEVAVCVIVADPREMGRHFHRAPLTLGVPSVSRVSPRVVLTLGGLTHGCDE